MRVLVAGGAGFVGSHLVDRLLDEGHEVDVLDDLSSGSLGNLAEARAQRTGRLKIHQVDVRDPEVTSLIARRAPEVVYGLTPSSVEDPVAHAERWVLGCVRLLDGAHRAGSSKVVLAVGAEIYGQRSDAGRPLRESEVEVSDVASAAPVAVLGYLRAYREVHGLEFALLVLSSVYGPRQRQGVVAEFVRRCWSDEVCVVAGDGRQTRDLIFVDDAVDALVRAAERASGLVVNVATGQETSVGDLRERVAAAVAAAGGPECRFVTADDGPPIGARRSSLDPGRARIQLGWSSWTLLDEGVRETVTASAPEV